MPRATTRCSNRWQPSGPWLGAASPLYHTRQIVAMKRAGIDALAVVLPPGAAARAAWYPRLSALVQALREYDQANTTPFMTSTPLLLPLLDCSTAELDLRGTPGQTVLADALDDFYRLVPPQYRAMLNNASGNFCYPVILTAPGPAMHWDDTFPGHIAAHLSAQWGMPVGWMLDASWNPGKTLPGVLSVCNWNTTVALQQGEGPVSVMSISPGSATAHQHFSRRGGAAYENGWLKITTTNPDFILLRSWNDFSRGTEIAPSRQYGYQFVDSTKLATLRLVNRLGFGVRLLNHTLPPVVQPGQNYPVELMVKNGSVEKMFTRAGCRVDYRIFHHGELVAKGTATQALVLFDASTARVRFPLFTGLDRDHPFAAGNYELNLDFRRNRVPFMNLPFMLQTMGTLIIPFTISNPTAVAQLINSDTPSDLQAGAELPMTVQLRNLGAALWRKQNTHFQLRWATVDGTPLAAESVSLLKQNESPGDIFTLQSTLPPAPQQAGWYQLQLSCQPREGVHA